jgi:hypothetical protein
MGEWAEGDGDKTEMKWMKAETKQVKAEADGEKAEMK